MKKTALTLSLCAVAFLLIFSGHRLYAETEMDSYEVLAQPGINIREKPDIHSRVVGSIPFGKVVRGPVTGIDDTVGEFTSRWYQVRYKGISGYVWGRYLSLEGTLSRGTEPIADVCILREGAFCGSFPYSPGLTWYGLYPTDKPHLQELKKIDLAVIFSTTLSLEERAAYNDKGKYQDLVGNLEAHGFIVETGIEKRSLFLIGSREPLRTGLCNGYYSGDLRQLFYEPKESQFIYPEQIRSFKLANGKGVAIKAGEEAYINDTQPPTIRKRYELELVASRDEFFKYEPYHSRNITELIPFHGAPAFRHAIYKNPVIVWYGDVDGDGKVDLLFYSCMMNDTGGATCAFTLLLSSKAAAGDFIGKVAQFVWGGCYG
ncbi:MAG: SH3 domain-containing protein [bacterium]|nr:SH3 domain-containing protein [bacterium]